MIKTNLQIHTCSPDLVLVNKKKRICLRRSNRSQHKYKKNLIAGPGEFIKTVIQIIIGTPKTISKDLEKRVGGEAKNLWKNGNRPNHCTPRNDKNSKKRTGEQRRFFATSVKLTWTSVKVTWTSVKITWNLMSITSCF